MTIRHWVLIASVGSLLAACGAAFHPRSANPYEPDRGPATGGGAGVGIAPAAAAVESIQRRMEGECYVPCLHGTACNPATGMCDALPCRGECKPGEYCDTRGFVDRCVPEPSHLFEIVTSAKPPAPKKPLPADAPQVESGAEERAPTAPAPR